MFPVCRPPFRTSGLEKALERSVPGVLELVPHRVRSIEDKIIYNMSLTKLTGTNCNIPY